MVESSSEEWRDDTVDIVSLFNVLWQRRWWIAIPTIGLAAVVCAIAFWMTPIYRASAVLISASEERGSMGTMGAALGQLSGLASLAGISLSSGASEVEEALAVARSRQFIGNFIQEKNLLPALYPKKWDAIRGEWTVPKAEQPTPGDGYRYFTTKIMTVTQDKKTGLITLRIDWRDRPQAAEWVNDLVKRLNAEMRARAKEKADASVKYLQSELIATSDIGTREAINRLIEAQIRQRMLANVSQEYAFRVVDKAVVPDLRDKVRPKRMLMTAGGALLGLMASICLVLLLNGLRKQAAH